MSSFQEEVAKVCAEWADWPDTPAAWMVDGVPEIFALSEMVAIREALIRMIGRIDSEWGSETEDHITEWAEVFDLPANVIAWLKS